MTRQTTRLQHQPSSGEMETPPPRRWPPGFRFSPTDEELVLYFLKRRIVSGRPSPYVADVEVYKSHPSHLPGTRPPSFPHPSPPIDRFLQSLRRPLDLELFIGAALQRGRRCRRGTGSGSSSAGWTASTPTARAPAAPLATDTGRPRGRTASSAAAAGRWATRRRWCTTTAGPRAGSARTGSCTSIPYSPTRSRRPRRGGSPTRCTSSSRRAGPGPRTANSTVLPLGRRIGWMTTMRE